MSSPVKRDYIDALGFPRRVLLPAGESDVETGIPASLDLEPLYGHMPDDFQIALTKALHARGLVEPGDYFKSGAAERFRAALLSVIKHDFLNVQNLAKKEMDRNG